MIWFYQHTNIGFRMCTLALLIWHVIGSSEPWASFLCASVSDVFNMNYLPHERHVAGCKPSFLKSTLFAPNFTAGRAEVRAAKPQVRLTAGNCPPTPPLLHPPALSVLLQYLWAHTQRPSTCGQRLRCTWTAVIPGSLLHSHFRVVSTSQPSFSPPPLSTTQPLPHPHTVKFCFLTLPKAGMFPTGCGSALCVLITFSCVHPHRHRRSIQFHLLTFDILECELLSISELYNTEIAAVVLPVRFLWSCVSYWDISFTLTWCSVSQICEMDVNMIHFKD